MALRSIRGNKIRSFLTMLGIIIGVSSVIVLVSISKASSNQISSQIGALGTNLISVNFFGSNSNSSNYTLEDAQELSKIAGVKEIAPVVSSSVTIKKDRTSSNVSLIGTNAAYETVKNTNVTAGRFISDIDDENRSKVVVLGANTAETLFGIGNPVGQSVQINGTSFTIIGVLKSSGSSLGSSGDDLVILPLSIAQRVIQDTNIGSVYISAKSTSDVNFVKNSIESNLATHFGGKTDGFNVSTQEDLMQTMNSVTNTMTLLLGGIASISLLVGGIGIMNIMLVSVSERTKEIGIRKAIGAKRGDILTQFLIESVVLSSLGGIIGVGLGMLLTKVFAVFMSTTVTFSLSVLLMSFLFSFVIGVVFGVFPAYKASNMRPIQALRFE
ncbi:ABC transporter permease [Bacillus sp. RG28]|uniref:ABC transporter permease n=2 Tax=Gottfriedia endophytica TaxID=2820819 RepID=A0A940SIX1_9BACI|nr:ABC transporter permease [Gottfriedia endophytica]